MDATKEDSFFVIGSRAGMKEEEISNCLQVRHVMATDYGILKIHFQNLIIRSYNIIFNDKVI